MKRFWVRWTQPTEDERPITFPPHEAILGWWRTGYTCDAALDLPVVPILCALVEAENALAAKKAIEREWPEADFTNDNHFAQETTDAWRPPADRFPILSWMIDRLRPK